MRSPVCISGGRAARGRRHIAAVLALGILAGACRDANGPHVTTPSALPAQPSFTNLWRAESSLPRPLTALAAVLSGSCAWVMGGHDTTVATNDVQTWCHAAPGWTVGLPLPDARYAFAGAGAIGNRIYLAGGLNHDSLLTNTLFVYSPTTGWKVDAERMPMRLGCGAAAVVSGKLFVFGTAPHPAYPNGRGCSGFAHFFVYDPTVPQPPRWRQLPDIPGAYPSRLYPGVAALDSLVYVVSGGSDTGGAHGDMWAFDANSEQWLTGPLPGPRQAPGFGPAVVAARGRLYSLGGYDAEGGVDNSAEVYSYEPGTNAWDHLRPMRTMRVSHGAVATQGLIAVFGGGHRTPWNPPIDSVESIALGPLPSSCDPFEPDDDLTRATPLLVGDPYLFTLFLGPHVTQARLCATGDVDEFTYGENLALSVSELHFRLTPPPAADYQIEVYDATGTRLLAASRKPGAVPEDVNVPYQILTTYVIRVTSQDGSFDPVRPYRIELLP